MGMKEILQGIVSVLEADSTVSSEANKITVSQLVNKEDVAAVITNNQIPCILVFPEREESEEEFSYTKRVTYTINFLLMHFGKDPDALYNVLDFYENVRTALNSNKRLEGLVDGMNFDGQAIDLQPIRDKNTKLYSARLFSMSWWEVVEYDPYV